MPIINSGERMHSMVLDQPLMAGLSFLLFLPYNTASLINLKYDSTAWRRLVFSKFQGHAVHLGAHRRFYKGLAMDKRWYRFWHQIPAACDGPCE